MSKLMVTGALLVTAVLGVGVSISAAAEDGPNTQPEEQAKVAAAASPRPRVTAVVGPNGGEIRGIGLRSVGHPNPGVYIPRFNRNIKKCAWVGTVGRGGFSGTSGPGLVTITGRNGTNNALYVETYDVDGNLTNLPFHVIVVCS